MSSFGCVFVVDMCENSWGISTFPRDNFPADLSTATFGIVFRLTQPSINVTGASHLLTCVILFLMCEMSDYFQQLGIHRTPPSLTFFRFRVGFAGMTTEICVFTPFVAFRLAFTPWTKVTTYTLLRA